MLRRTKTRPTQAKPRTEGQERAALAQALGTNEFPSACGTCGGQVAVNDPEAVQTTRQIGRYPHHRTVRSWRYHGVCSRAGGGAALLALVLDPTARPVRVTQAHYDVAQSLGVPLTYQELEDASSTDHGRGRHRFQHVGKAELEELRAAVEKRHQELTEPVAHASGWPCAVCGRSHELADGWSQFQGRPVCGACAELVKRSQIPGNHPLWQQARNAMFAQASHLLPARADTWPLPLAKDMPGYSRHDCKVTAEAPELAPWAYVADLPEIPLSQEEALAARLAEVEKRLAGAVA